VERLLNAIETAGSWARDSLANSIQRSLDPNYILTLIAALGAGRVAQEPVVDDKRWMDSGFVRDIRNHARRLWNEDEFSCSWNDENKEHYIVRAAMLAAAPPPPAAVQEPVAVKGLQWSDPRKPDGKESFQDHCVAISSIGEYRIEWKSWKGDGAGYGIDSALGWVGCEYSLDDAKAAAQVDYEQHIRSALSTSQSDPAPEIEPEEIQHENNLMNENDALRAENERLRTALPEELTGKLQWAMHDAFAYSKADTIAGRMIAVYDAVRAAVAPEQGEAK
jgi:hypothetical protein